MQTLLIAQLSGIALIIACHSYVRWLADRELKLDEISYASGFGSLAVFSRQFKQQYGTPPSRYHSRVQPNAYATPYSR